MDVFKEILTGCFPWEGLQNELIQHQYTRNYSEHPHSSFISPQPPVHIFFPHWRTEQYLHRHQSPSPLLQSANQGNPKNPRWREDDCDSWVNLELPEHGRGAGGGVHPEEPVGPGLAPVLAPERLGDQAEDDGDQAGGGEHGGDAQGPGGVEHAMTLIIRKENFIYFFYCYY